METRNFVVTKEVYAPDVHFRTVVEGGWYRVQTHFWVTLLYVLPYLKRLTFCGVVILNKKNKLTKDLPQLYKTVSV